MGDLGSAPVAGWLGIDVGWVYPAVDSEGQIFHWATRYEKRKARGYLATAGDVTVTKPDGTTYTQQAYSPEAAATIMSLAEGDLRQRSRRLAMTIVAKAFYRGLGVALDDLRFSDDRNREKRWLVVQRAIAVQCEERQVPVVWVNAAYTSQTCTECGHVSKANRPTRGRFQCEACGHSGHADRVAAVNVSRRACVKQPPMLELPMAMDARKRCNGCRLFRWRTDFTRSGESRDGLSTRCAACTATKSTLGGDPEAYLKRRRERLAARERKQFGRMRDWDYHPAALELGQRR